MYGAISRQHRRSSNEPTALHVGPFDQILGGGSLKPGHPFGSGNWAILSPLANQASRRVADNVEMGNERPTISMENFTKSFFFISIFSSTGFVLCYWYRETEYWPIARQSLGLYRWYSSEERRSSFCRDNFARMQQKNLSSGVTVTLIKVSEHNERYWGNIYIYLLIFCYLSAHKYNVDVADYDTMRTAFCSYCEWYKVNDTTLLAGLIG